MPYQQKRGAATLLIRVSDDTQRCWHRS